MIQTQYILIIAIVVICSALFVQAHLDGGIDVPAGDYIVDVGYDIPELVALRPTVFLISLIPNESAQEVVPSQSVWVRITSPQAQQVFLAKLVPEPTGTYSFSTTLPKSGQYTMTVRFDGTEKPVQASIPLTVASVQDPIAVLGWSLAIIFGVVLVLYIFKSKKNSHKK